MTGRILTRTGVLAAALALGMLLVPAPALALTNPTLTLDQEVGGIPTRFTFAAVTDADAPLSSLRLKFPTGFGMSGANANVITLQELTRVPVSYTQKIDGTSLDLRFDPPLPVSRQLRVVVYDVVTREKGGAYQADVSYVAGAAARTEKPLGFSYSTPSRSELISRWLDTQSWVRWLNQFKFVHMFLSPQVIVLAVPIMFVGWLLSIALVLLAFPLAIAGGLVLAFAKMSKIPPARWLAAIYVNVMRGTPLFLQIFIAFIGLRMAGISTSDFITAVLVLALNSSAYLAEIFRAGIQSIHSGQMEASSSLGMTYFQSMRYVIIPQTVKRVLPTMTSEFILLFKDTSLLSAMGVFELMMYANNLSVRKVSLTPFMVAAAYYLIVTIPLINWVGRLESKLAVSEHGQGSAETRRRRWLGGLKPVPELAPAVPEGSTAAVADARDEAV